MKPTRVCLTFRLLALSSCFLVGCGDEQSTFPAGGTIKFADGSPLVGGLVEFQLAENITAPTAKATTGPDGDFQLGTFEKRDGALPGRHKVMIVAPALISEDWEKKLKEKGGRLPKGGKRHEMDLRYRSYATSGLSYTVTENAEENRFDIVVDSK